MYQIKHFFEEDWYDSRVVSFNDVMAAHLAEKAPLVFSGEVPDAASCYVFIHLRDFEFWVYLYSKSDVPFGCAASHVSEGLSVRLSPMLFYLGMTFDGIREGRTPRGEACFPFEYIKALQWLELEVEAGRLSPRNGPDDVKGPRF